MLETRSHISESDILHIVAVTRRRARLSLWKIIALVILAVPVIVGLIDVLSRLSALLRPAPAAELTVSQEVGPLSAASLAESPSGIVPARLTIPAIGVNAHVQKVGTNSAGAMEAPSNFTDVGWYESGSEPGASGSAVIDGHVNNALTTAGVFEHLAQVRIGDQIVVSDASGSSVTFVVTSVKTYPADQAPTQEIFSRAGPPQLALVTCDGVWNATEHQFTNRLVVFAEPASNA